MATLERTTIYVLFLFLNVQIIINYFLRDFGTVSPSLIAIVCISLSLALVFTKYIYTLSETIAKAWTWIAQIFVRCTISLPPFVKIFLVIFFCHLASSLSAMRFVLQSCRHTKKIKTKKFNVEHRKYRCWFMAKTRSFTLKIDRSSSFANRLFFMQSLYFRALIFGVYAMQ